MNDAERDALLIRLDERSCNTWQVMEKLEKHNAEQNGFILESLIRSSGNRVWLKIITGVGGSAILFFAGLITKIMKLW